MARCLEALTRSPSLWEPALGVPHTGWLSILPKWQLGAQEGVGRTPGLGVRAQNPQPQEGLPRS